MYLFSVAQDETQLTAFFYRWEEFILGAGEKKVVMVPDTRQPDTALFTFHKEDHTLGNLLRERLIKNSRVMFCGYKVPHPLVPDFVMRVQTNGDLTPKEAVIQACRDLVNDLEKLNREFTKEWELKKMVGGGGPDGTGPGY
jgi:DNA-directed RNA polymerase subunit L